LKGSNRHNHYALTYWHPTLFPGAASAHREAFEKYEFLFEFEEGDNFNHKNTLGIFRINI
jgi:hypothetical protein